ncbi:class I SAM-dependent methyltransferase [Aliarcobacter cryaerophilus]|uniref:class I SAM-dependent methyltransferase n=1 Tax=Aliarcobacter cryaerophilus TaxID=28198 RepID=UPI00082D917B|nr:class I SAM-dependent methyltransferase [Aliarcobacter cryaerophilus]
MQQKISKCRICGHDELSTVLNLGTQKLTGIFPKIKKQLVTEGPVELIKCIHKEGCGLVQIAHRYDIDEFYGENYGYRSGLNRSMVEHLRSKVKKVLSLVSLNENDIVVDIGSNDGTTLGFYPINLSLIGIDPSGEKFKEYYASHIKLLPDFFSANTFLNYSNNKKAKVITSFSMFYDLEDPIKFMEEIEMSLADDGIWVFEQSYMPLMLERNSYDTVCQEHIEYYALKQIKWMCDKVGLKILDIEFNDINGGSFSIVAAKSKSSYQENEEQINTILNDEKAKGLDTVLPWLDFQKRIDSEKKNLIIFLENCKKNGQKVFGLGASTKGNVLLQYCDITPQQIEAIGEVNKDKYGCFTPGTLIPIISEDEALNSDADYYLILPWHFRDFFINNLKFKNKKLLFPLPKVEVIEC